MLYARDSPQGTVYCINTTDGTLLWKANTGQSFLYEVPAVSFDGSVAFAAGYFSIIAFSVMDGSVLWEHSISPAAGGWGLSTPAITATGNIAVTYTHGYEQPMLLVLDGQSGERLWNATVHNSSSKYNIPPVAHPTKDIIYYAGPIKGCQLGAFQGSTGELLWSTTSCGFYSPALDLVNNHLIVERGKGSPSLPSTISTKNSIGAPQYSNMTLLAAYDMDTGALVWVTPSPNLSSQPIVSSNGVIYTNGDSYVPALMSAFSSEDGSFLWQKAVSADGLSQPVLAADGTLYSCGMTVNSPPQLWVFRD